MSEQKDDARNSGEMRCSSFCEEPPSLASAICVVVWLLVAFIVVVWIINDYNYHHSHPSGNSHSDFHPFPYEGDWKY